MSFKTSYYVVHKKVAGLDVAPYVTGGIGHVVARRDNKYVHSVQQAVFLWQGCCGEASYREETIGSEQIVADERSFSLGGGIDLGFSSRISIRPEFKYFGAASQNMTRGSLILAFHW